MAKQNQEEDDAPEQEPEDREEPEAGAAEPDDEGEGGEGKREPKVKIKPEEDGGVTVELPRRSRTERRNNRVSRYTDEVKKLREENERVTRHLAELTAHVTRQQQQPYYQPQRQDADPYEQEVGHIRSEMETIQTALRSGAVQNPTDIERARQRFYALDTRLRDLSDERIEKRVLERMRKEHAVRDGEHEEAVLKAEFPDVIQHQQAMQYARGEYFRLVAKGKPPTLATTREAMLAAAHEFGLRQRQLPAPTPAQQQRYGAVPQQAGARTTPGGVRLTTTDMKIAIARWPDDDEHVAYAKMDDLLQKAAKEGSAQE